jgi:hypothetical protein
VAIKNGQSKHGAKTKTNKQNKKQTKQKQKTQHLKLK